MNNPYLVCSDRELHTLPTQWLLAEQWAKVGLLLHDFEFIDAKIGRLGVEELLQDYTVAIDILPGENDWFEKIKATKKILEMESHNLRKLDDYATPAFHAQQIYNQAVRNRLLFLTEKAANRLSQINQPSILLKWKTANAAAITERILVGHHGAVNELAVTPDGNLLVSASNDCTLKVWELETGKEHFTLNGHQGSVTAVQVTQEGKHAISASSDGTLKIWNLKSGLEERTLTGHISSVLSLQITPDDKEAISVSSDGAFAVWDLQNGKLLRTFKNRRIASIYALHGLIWRLAGIIGFIYGAYLVILKLGHTMGWAVIFPIFFLGIFIYVCLFLPYMLEIHLKRRINLKAIALIGKNWVVSGDEGGSIRKWDFRSGEEEGFSMKSANEKISLAVLPNDRIISGDGTGDHSDDKPLIEIWDLITGSREYFFEGHTDEIRGIVLSPNGHLLASGSKDCTIRIWNVRTGKNIDVLYGHSQSVNSIIFTPDQRKLISASDDSTIRVWEMESIDETFEPAKSEQPIAINALAITSSNLEAVATSTDGLLRTWEIKTGNEKRKHILKERIKSAVIVPFGNRVVFGMENTTLIVYNTLTGELESRLTHDEGLFDFFRLTVFDVSLNGARAISLDREFIPLESLAVSQGTLKESERIDLWDVDSGKLIYTTTFSAKDLILIAISPDGQHAMLGSRDGNIRFWFLGEMNTIKTTGGVFSNMLTTHQEYFVGQHKYLTTLKISSDGQYAISGAEDGMIIVWDVAIGKKLYAKHLHEDRVVSLATTIDGHYAISGAEDGFLKVWNLVTGKTEVVAQLNLPIKNIAVGKDGSTILVGDSAGNVQCFQLKFFR